MPSHHGLWVNLQYYLPLHMTVTSWTRPQHQILLGQQILQLIRCYEKLSHFSCIVAHCPQVLLQTIYNWPSILLTMHPIDWQQSARICSNSLFGFDEGSRLFHHQCNGTLHLIYHCIYFTRHQPQSTSAWINRRIIILTSLQQTKKPQLNDTVWSTVTFIDYTT
jgi:hypothetical protein